jgi:hypothetical protein
MTSVVYNDCRFAERRYAECHFAECRYAECRSTLMGPSSLIAEQGVFYNLKIMPY